MNKPNKHKEENIQIKAARIAEILTKVQLVGRRHLYWENFVRGMVFGAGSVIGATVIIAAFVWILSLFDTVPLIGPVIDSTRETIKQR